MELPRPLLRHYHFNVLSLSVCEHFDPSSLQQNETLYPPLFNSALTTDVQSALLEGDDESLVVVILSVRKESTEEMPFPYVFQAEAEGLFAVENMSAEFSEAREREVALQGANHLYAAIREQILTLSSRHKYGPIMLPDLRFGD